MGGSPGSDESYAAISRPPGLVAGVGAGLPYGRGFVGVSSYCWACRHAVCGTAFEKRPRAAGLREFFPQARQAVGGAIVSVYNYRGWNASETPLFSGDRERVFFGKNAGFETRAGGKRRVAGMRGGHEGDLFRLCSHNFLL